MALHLATKNSERAVANDEPGGASIVQPHVRVYTFWTPALIRAAEISADTGYLRLVANLCDWLLGDDRIKGCLDTRTQSLFGLDPAFERSGDKRRSGRAVRALETSEDWWDSYPEAENLLLTQWGIVLGVAPGLHHWEDGGETHGGRLLAKPEFWHPQHVRYDWMTRKWMTRIASGTDSYIGSSEIELVPGDGQWILHRPYGKDRPWAMGIWRGLARLALLKSYALDDWARLGESASKTVATGDGAIESNKEQRLALAEQISNCGRDGSIVLPPGWDLKLVEASAVTKDIYDQQIAMANEAIAVLIRGGNLTTIVHGGSRAAAETQQETGDKNKLRFDAQAFTTTIHDESLTWWAKYNFGDAGLAPWPVYPVEQDENLKVKAETMASAATALQAFQTLGFDIDREAFAEAFELSDFLVVPKGEPPIAPKALPPAPPAGAPAQEATREPGQADTPAASAEGPQMLADTGDNGQDYVDRLVDDMTPRGAKELAPALAAVLSAVAKSQSYDEAKALIVKAYGKTSTPLELAQLTEAALVMAQLGGHLAVDESPGE